MTEQLDTSDAAITKIEMVSSTAIDAIKAKCDTALARVGVLEAALRFCAMADQTPGGIIRCAANVALTPTARADAAEALGGDDAQKIARKVWDKQFRSTEPN